MKRRSSNEISVIDCILLLIGQYRKDEMDGGYFPPPLLSVNYLIHNYISNLVRMCIRISYHMRLSLVRYSYHTEYEVIPPRSCCTTFPGADNIRYIQY
jgi:hypothetical protein